MSAMVGPHDIGGMKLGAVPIEHNEPVFHADWERVVFGATISAIIKGVCNVDEFRSGIEQMDPERYLTATYYEKWLFALEYYMKRAGALSDAEIAAEMVRWRGALESRPGKPGPTGARSLPEREDQQLLDTINWLIPNGASSRREIGTAPLYCVGEKVRGRFVEPAPHTRIPHYCQGKTGRVRRIHDAYPLPDEVVRHGPELPQYLYAVAFTAVDLWPDAEADIEVLVDLWESYLEPVS
jgi:nitrile hydratase